MPQKLPWQVHAFIALTAVFVAGVALLLVDLSPESVTGRHLILGLILTALFAACARFPLLLAPRYQQELSAAPGIAAAMLLPLPLSLAACLVGQVAGDAVRRKVRPAFRVFNTATVVLQVGLSGAAFHAITGQFSVDSAFGGALGLFAACAIYFVVGAVLMESCLALLWRRRPAYQWLDRHGETARAELSLLLIGGIFALVADVRPWTLPLMAVPVAVIYRAFFSQQTDLRQAREEQREAQAARERLTAMVEATPDFVATADASGHLEYINAAGRKMLGIPEDADLASISIAGYFTEWRRAVSQALRTGLWSAETHVETSDGSRPVSQVVVAHRDPAGQVEFISTIARDITERKDFEDRLVYLANHDGLTELFNRRRFEQELQRRVVGSRPGELGALLFIDLDGFKSVNDQHGHMAGDALLQGIASELRNRATRREDVVARLGGDEFAVLISRAHAMQAELAAHRILAAIRDFRINVDGVEIGLGGSIGVATFTSGWADAAEVMGRADAAMYEAKQKRLGVVVAREPEASRKTA